MKINVITRKIHRLSLS